MDRAPARRAAALMLVALSLVLSFPPVLQRAEGGRVSLSEFPDGGASREILFLEGGTNSSTALRLPKAAVIQSAGVVVDGRPLLDNISILLDTREDFAACELRNLDINSTQGSVRLLRVEGRGDEFTSAQLDPKWSWFNEPPKWDVNATRAGHLHMVSAPNTQFHGNEDDGHIIYQEANGSFMIETKLSSTPAHNYEKAGLVVRHDSGNYVLLKYQNNTGKTVQAAVKERGTMWSDMTRWISAASPIWLRLERDNRTFISSYSTGTTWTQHYQWSVAIEDPVMVGLFVADGNAGTNYTADFDYFRFTQYLFNGSLLSPTYRTANPVLAMHILWDGPVSPSSTGFVFSARTDPSAQWEGMLWNSSLEPQRRGREVQFRIDMTSLGLRTPELYCVTLNLTTGSFPTGVSLALGGGPPVWTSPGELREAAAVDILQPLREYMASAPADPDGLVTVPLVLSTSTAGYLTLRNLTIEYLIGDPPEAPSLLSPADGSFVPSLHPSLTLVSSDPELDPLLYSIELAPEAVGTWQNFSQDASASGWSSGPSPYASGAEATLELPRYLATGATYLWRARAFDGAYWSPYSETRRFTVDDTPPEGSVRDEGEVTLDPGSLRAELNFSDPESGVEGYEFMLGTGKGLQDVLPTTCATGPEAVAEGLSLDDGPVYYFSARARNRAGLWSEWAFSDGIRFHLPDAERLGIRIDSPAEGSVLRGIAVVSGSAWNRDGWGNLSRVQLRLGAGLWKQATVSGEGWSRNWTTQLDTTALPDGNYTMQARLVQDLLSGSVLAVDRVGVTVVNQGPPPELGAEFLPEGDVVVEENGSVEFSVSNVTLQAVYTWMVDGEARAATSSSFVYRPSFTAAGRHVVTALVNAGPLIARRDWNVTVLNVNRPPVAIITEPREGQRLEAGREELFDASTSYDPDPEDEISFSWALGDGAFLDGRAAQHSYERGGCYTVVLRVSDGHTEVEERVTVYVAERPRTVSQASVDALGLAAPWVLGAALVLSAAGAALSARAMWRRRTEDRRRAEARKPVRIDLGLEEIVEEMAGRHRPRPALLDDGEGAGFREFSPEALEGLPEAETEPVEELPEAEATPLEERPGEPR
ncbi:MAG: DUF1349 domain-containing protein [Thermoplasmatota archaeon]